MRLRHGISHQVRRLARRFPVLRSITLTTTLVTLAWLYILHWGERTVFQQHIDACDWATWEKWPSNAAPHHLVLISDPQLVDPHTYPGRPWPLSSLTERYTDLYMARNFRLMNAVLDPDSIVFLGDLFDGGREWAPTKSRPLTWAQRSRLVDLGIVPPNPQSPDKKTKKRSLDSYRQAVVNPHGKTVIKGDHALGPDDADLKDFKYSEESQRWKRYDDRQWKKDLKRFSRIFWDPRQIYPGQYRDLFPAYARMGDEESVANGAENVTRFEYASSGGKQRFMFASLPGNHDLGFGSGIQWTVRDRFQAHFGDGNQIFILGNHTFVSLDTPSLSAKLQWLRYGGETKPEDLPYLEHLFKPANDFLSDLHTPAAKLVGEHLQGYYPLPQPPTRRPHKVEDIDNSYYHKNFKRDDPSEDSAIQLPVALLTHVPLYRDPDVNCGPLRERGVGIPIAFGYQYQNTLAFGLSHEIVTKVGGAGEIIRVFSGDDHDYCDVTHRYNVGPWNVHISTEGIKTQLKMVREITVKTFSWAMGVRRPGFELVSLWNPIDASGQTIGTPLPTMHTHLCLLPDQLAIFLRYALFAAITSVILVLRATILALRPQEDQGASSRWKLPNQHPQSNGWANSHNLRARSRSSSERKRTSSTSTSTNRGNLLGVQRSFNARTRSVSPDANTGKADFQPAPGTLIEKAGYHPKVPWRDPNESDSDEESRLAGDWDDSDSGGDDKGTKWKAQHRRRNRSPFWRAVDILVSSNIVICTPCAVWYFWLISHG